MNVYVNVNAWTQCKLQLFVCTGTVALELLKVGFFDFCSDSSYSGVCFVNHGRSSTRKIASWSSFTTMRNSILTPHTHTHAPKYVDGGRTFNITTETITDTELTSHSDFRKTDSVAGGEGTF